MSAFLPDAPGQAPQELYRAIEQFNRGMFWECHETLEDVWRNTSYPLRFFYHAIIKAAVGFYHLSRHNRHGARVKLGDAARLLRLFPARFLGVLTDPLREEISVRLGLLGGDDPVDWVEMDALSSPHIGQAT